MSGTRAAPPSPAVRTLRPGLVLVGILLVAANLRASITVVGPLLGEVRDDLALSAAASSALVSLPLVCFAVFSPVAPAIAHRLGHERTLGLSLAVLALGIVTRSLPWAPLLWVGTVLLGLAIATMNVLLPALLKRDFPRDAGRLTGVYSAVQSGAAAAASGLAVPVAGVVVGAWRGAFGVWAGLALVGLGVFAPQLVRRATAAPGRGPARPGEPLAPSGPARPGTGDPAPTPSSPPAARSPQRSPGHSPWRAPLAWQVTLFMGLQSTLFYCVLTWWPSIEQTHGASTAAAGLHQGLMQVCGIAGSLLAAALLHRSQEDQRLLATLLVPLPALAVVGELAAPGLAIVWNVLLGLGTGGLIVLALALFGLRTRHHREAAALSGMAQSVGYLLAAAGPPVLGALHDATHGWTVPLLVLLGLQAVQLVAARLASRPRFVDAGRAVAPTHT